MTTDPYKAMTIAYNHLNLPKLFTWTGGSFNGNSVEILYDAAGTKLKKTVKTGATVNYTQEYLGGIEYRDGAREAIYTAEGRVKYTSPTTTRYEYTIRDHLGNARISFSDLNGNGVVNETNNPTTNEVLQENHYYPFGLNTDGPWMNDAALDNKYQYNQAEFNDDFGLNYCFTLFRTYDPAVGRWGQADPLSEMAMSWNSYQHGYNDPNYWNDPLGLINNPGFGQDVWNMVSSAWNRTANGTNAHYESTYNPYGGREIGREINKNNVNIQYSGGYGVIATDSVPNSFSGAFWDFMRAGDRWAQGSGGQSFVQGVNDLNPLISGINSFYGFRDGQNIYGENISKTQAALYAVGAVPPLKVSGVAANGGMKLLSQYNSIEGLLEGAGALSKVKGGLQGFIKGDGPSILKGLTQNAKPLPRGRFLLSDGTNIGSHFSSTTGVFTINFNRAGEVFKIRVKP